MEKVFDTSKIKVAVGLSGGVDSSVTALLLKEVGFDVTCVYLKCYWTHVGCSSDKDRTSAAKVASFLDLPFEVWDFEKEYKEKVIDYFYSEYEKGRTPNPDIVCNREIKFGLFFEKAVKERGFNFIATGHYAGCGLQDQRSKIKDQNGWILPFSYQKIAEGDNKDTNLVVEPKYFELLEEKGKNRAHFDTYYNGPSIFGGVDKSKDQSYFLYDIEEKAIEHTLYPLFGLLKSEVRQMAKTSNLPTANRPDSQGICFIGEVNIEKFLKERISEKPGEVVDVGGNVIGNHKGIPFYTVGQRHGFSISKIKDQSSKLGAGVSRLPREVSSLANPESSYKGPLYVIGKDVKRNRLVVGAGEECKREAFTISKFKSQSSNLNLKSEKLFVRIRHLGEMIPCRVVGLDSRVSAETAAVGLGYNSASAQGGSASGGKPPPADALSVSDWRAGRSRCGLPLSASYPANQFLDVKLDYPVFGVAPGQSAVVYRRVVGAASASRLTQGVPPRIRSGSSSTFAVTRDSAPTALQADVWRVVGGGVIE